MCISSGLDRIKTAILMSIPIVVDMDLGADRNWLEAHQIRKHNYFDSGHK